MDFASPSASSPKAWREDAFTSACPGGQGGPNDYPRERQLDLVVHDFNGPQLHNHNEDHAQYFGTFEAAQAHAEDLITKAKHSHDTFQQGESLGLVRGCRIDPVRETLLAYLRDPRNSRQHRHNAAIKILGACSYVINEHKGKVENDLLQLALDKDAPETVRDQTVLSLMELSCPSLDVLRALDRIGTQETDSPIGESATLTMGTMLRNRRACYAKAGYELDPHTDKYEAQLNAGLTSSLEKGDVDRADTILLAMHNSGSSTHLETIKAALEHHNFVMRSASLKHATTLALNAIGTLGHAHDSTLHSQLLELMQAPLQVDVSDVERAHTESRNQNVIPRGVARRVAAKMRLQKMADYAADMARSSSPEAVSAHAAQKQKESKSKPLTSAHSKLLLAAKVAATPQTHSGGQGVRDTRKEREVEPDTRGVAVR